MKFLKFTDDKPENVAKVACLVIGAVIAIIAIGSFSGIFNNGVGQMVRKASFIQKFVGFLFIAGTGYFTYLNAADKLKFRINSALAYALIFVGLALGTCFLCGWDVAI